ncbi:galactoside O-acetyltransferase [Pseudomassariella vexata]|uniref:Galactoside O-acetyltransferase n=1 Tax=Pseudomassariella vexata TaxID=1141098 RepID=A0A1Y2EG05_9PEZI|nr:galactoside O-acetyltransferase [Pseudomassariella vexata]ORY69725.1 galactoside O-acetyltransferase [Pseudomassariella vexata]
MDLRLIDLEENKRLMRNGELYYAFTPDLVADRKRCRLACEAYNQAGDVSRRRLVELFKKIQDDDCQLPPPASTPEEDEDLFGNEVWCDAPIKMDYGHNVVRFGDNVYVNSNSTWVDTCTISVGARTLIGPNCSFFSGTHPTDPKIRNGTNGPENGAPITIGEDCWFGGSVIVLPGVTIGAGATVGAGSVVTKDVPPYTVVVGNPARVLRSVASSSSNPIPAAQRHESAKEAASSS